MAYSKGKPDLASQPVDKREFGRVMRWLLRIDLPIPNRSDAEIAAEAADNYRWNFSVNLLDGASFMFGVSFVSVTTIIPLFISKLTTSTIPIGLVAVLAQGGWFLPQIFTSNIVEQLARKKPVVINLGFFSERVPMFGLVIAAILARSSPQFALALFLVSFAWFNLGAGVIATAWQELVARCFPVKKRGRFFGTSQFIGAGTGVFGAAISIRLLESFPFPTNFVYIFLIAAVSILISWIFLALTREPVIPVEAPKKSNRQFWSTLPDILQNDNNYRRFLQARLLFALGGMGLGFITVSAVQRWQIADSTVGVYTGVQLLGQAAGSLLFGWLADKYGHKISLELGAFATFLAFLLAWLAPSAEWYYVVFALVGIAFSSIIVSGILVIMEFCEPQRRPTYAGLTNSSIGVVGMVAPLIGAWLADINTNWLFALCAAVNLIAFIAFRWWVKEPRLQRGSLNEYG